MHLSLLMDCLLPVESTVQIGLENIWHEDIHKYQGKSKVIQILQKATSLIYSTLLILMKTNTVAIRYNERYSGSEKNEVDELHLKKKEQRK